MYCRVRVIAGLLVLSTTACMGLSAGCKRSEPVSESPSDVELAVVVPADSQDPGTLPEESTMHPPDIILAPDESVAMSLGAAETEAPAPTPDLLTDRQQADLPRNTDLALETEPANAVAGDSAAGPEDWRKWPKPDLVLAVTGQQYGYIEPCGCTGLANQKGGMMRRYTLYQQIREQGWELVPLDTGNQVRRTGRQAAIKFLTSTKAFEQMGYRVVGFGPNDLKLGASELFNIAADDGSGTNPFTTANVEILVPDMIAKYKKIDAGGHTIGVTTVLDSQTIGDSPVESDIVIGDANEKAAAVLQQMQEAGSKFNVLMFFGTMERARELAKQVPGYDLIVAGSTYGEPTYRPEVVEGTNTKIVMTGDKGMFVGLIGLYEGQEIKYAKVALDDKFEDAEPMLELMAGYQNQLKQLGLDGLGIKPVEHTSGVEFVGSQKCGECHTTAFGIWENTSHAFATAHIVEPGERSEIPRHFDPECLSCHVTGWNPQEYYPYSSGYLSLEQSKLLHGNGCENCHGPGKAHVDAEEGTSNLSDTDIAAIRESVRLTLDRARQKCLECHDLDNSPDFHLEGAFEDYWAEVEHYGVD